MDLRWLGSILIGAGCLALGYLFGSRRFSPLFLIFKTRQPSNDQLGPGGSSSGSSSSWKSNNRAKEPLEIERLLDLRDYFDLKMVLVVRNDLKMGKGKIAAQCSHATLGLYKKLFQRAPKALNRWETCAQPKVVLKIESEEEMLVLQEKAKSLKLPTHITIDAGRTQIAPNSRTVMAILGPVEVVDDVTGGLKLL